MSECVTRKKKLEALIHEWREKQELAVPTWVS